MLLEQMLEEQEKQINRGKSVEQIHCAAVMAQAELLDQLCDELARMNQFLDRVNDMLSNIEMNQRGTN